jgi:hypothetical protein
VIEGLAREIADPEKAARFTERVRARLISKPPSKD